MASQWPPKKGAAFNLSAFLYKTDNTLITNPGTLTLKISKDYGDWADSHNAGSTPSEEDSTYGQIKIALDTTDTNADVIDVYLVDNTGGCVPFTYTLYTTANTQDELGTSVASILAAVITNAAGTDIAADIIAIDALIDAFATTDDVADAILNRDMDAVSDTNARSPLNALRALRNKTSIVNDTLTVTKEDDVTSAWTASVTTDSGAEPITAVDPA